MKTYKNLRDYSNLDLKERSKSYLSEEIAMSYPIKENNEDLIDLNSFFLSNNSQFVYAPPQEIDLPIKLIKVRKTVASRLLKASKELPKNIIFRISEGFRPLWYQRAWFKKIYSDFKEKNKNLSDKQIWELTTEYIADPDLCPPHSTGGAIDLTLLDINHGILDMGSPINSINEKSATFYSKINKRQKENRMLLYETLTSVGFFNLPTEWWHYSYGDQYWAAFNKKSHALYNKIEK